MVVSSRSNIALTIIFSHSRFNLYLSIGLLIHSKLDIANNTVRTFLFTISNIKCSMLSKSSKWELSFVHYIAKYTISRFVTSRFECTTYLVLQYIHLDFLHLLHIHYQKLELILVNSMDVIPLQFEIWQNYPNIF